MRVWFAHGRVLKKNGGTANEPADLGVYILHRKEHFWEHTRWPNGPLQSKFLIRTAQSWVYGDRAAICQITFDICYLDYHVDAVSKLKHFANKASML